jgi:hypothetical protein
VKQECRDIFEAVELVSVRKTPISPLMPAKNWWNLGIMIQFDPMISM